MALEANAKRLALIHFDAENYPTLADRDKAGDKAKQTFSNTIVACDGMQLEI